MGDSARQVRQHKKEESRKTTREKAWKTTFLESLSKHGVVVGACRAAGIPRCKAYRERDRNRAFAEAWDDAVDESTDLMLMEITRRAREGVTRIRSIKVTDPKTKKTIYEKIEDKEYSDSLAMFILKARRPEEYRESYDLKRILDEITRAQTIEVSAGATAERVKKKRG